MVIGLRLAQMTVRLCVHFAIIHTATLNLVEQFYSAIPVGTERANYGCFYNLISVFGLQLRLQIS